MDGKPFFIVGSGRSGTTLLQGILNACDELFAPPESDFLARAFPFCAGAKSLTDADYAGLGELFVMTSHDNGWGMSRAEIIDILRAKRPQCFADVNRALYQAYLDRRGYGDAQWGIKSPVLIASLDRVLAVFPEARIVHMLRDGRDVCLSYAEVHEKAAEAFGPRGVTTGALYWVDGLRRVERLGIEALIEVRYEDLLTDPEGQIRRVLEFLGVRYRSGLHLTYLQSPRNEELVPEKHKADIHNKVSTGFDAANARKYVTMMPKRRRFLFELLAQPYFRKYAYPVEFEFLRFLPFSLLRRLAWALARWYNDWRYARRDRACHDHARRAAREAESSTGTDN